VGVPTGSILCRGKQRFLVDKRMNSLMVLLDWSRRSGRNGLQRVLCRGVLWGVTHRLACDCLQRRENCFLALHSGARQASVHASPDASLVLELLPCAAGVQQHAT
jgi:hypothetical protein